MADTYIISSTGTQDPLVLDDLGLRAKPHPVVSLDLFSIGLTSSQIFASQNLKDAITNGYITATYNGVAVTAGNVNDINISSHSTLQGLSNDDHTQYHNNTRGDARYFQKSEHINASAGAGDAGKPIKSDSSGKVDLSFVPQIAHSSLSGIGTNTHAQIDTFVASKAQASGLASLNGSSKVVQDPASASATPGASVIPIAGGAGTINSGFIPDLSSTYAIAAKGVTNGDSHDHNGGDGAQIAHSNLSGIGTNTHAQIDTFIASKAQANGLASLNASSKVVQDPASASATPGASVIPIAGVGGTIATGFIPDLSGVYAIAAKGVTNGDSHDHNGGDGAQIAHGNLSGIGTNTHAQIDTFIASKGQANGLASLDATGKVPSSQLPSFVDEVLEYANLASFPVTGDTGVIYVALNTNKTYRWSGSAYIEISPSEVTSVNGYTGVVVLTKSDIGLGNVPNLDTTSAVSNSHVQNTDTILDNGGANQITAATLKTHVNTSNIHFLQTDIDHTNLQNKGTNTHAQIDTFIASKAQASGLASLNASSKVVQDPASASATPGASVIPIAGGAGTIAAGFIPDLSGVYAIAAKGVTNGDSHDHNGGDGAQIDHGGLGGLADDDHTQYHNDARGDARYYQKTEFIATSAGVADAGKPIKTAADGKIDGTFIDSADVSLPSTSGTLPITKGGTGQTTQTAAFDALSPTTTKGDLIVRNNTNNIRLPVGTDGHILTADSASAEGVKWAANTGSSSAVFGTQLQYAESNALSTATGSNGWNTKVSFTTPSLPAGTYRISWSYTWYYTDISASNRRFEGRLMLDGVSVWDHAEIPANNSTVLRATASGIKHSALTAATHTISLDFRTTFNSATAGIADARVEFWRVS